MSARRSPQGLRLRKLADRTGEPDKNGTWPLAGVVIEGQPPKACRVSQSFVMQAKAEGWVEVEGEEIVHRPGGPANNEWAVTHTFVHASVIVFKTTDGDIRYRVSHQPDKYVEGGSDRDEVTPEIYAAGATRVDWFFDLELAGGK